MDQLDVALSALSHSSRRAIIRRLAKSGPARVTEIAEPFNMSLNAISKHLKMLEQAGLVKRTVVGREHLISFEPKPLREISKWVHTYEKFWSDHLDKLEAHFQNRKQEKQEGESD